MPLDQLSVHLRGAVGAVYLQGVSGRLLFIIVSQENGMLLSALRCVPVWNCVVLKHGVLLRLLFDKSYAGSGSSLSCSEDRI